MHAECLGSSKTAEGVLHETSEALGPCVVVDDHERDCKDHTDHQHHQEQLVDHVEVCIDAVPTVQERILVHLVTPLHLVLISSIAIAALELIPEGSFEAQHELCASLLFEPKLALHIAVTGEESLEGSKEWPDHFPVIAVVLVSLSDVLLGIVDLLYVETLFLHLFALLLRLFRQQPLVQVFL